jgi:tRNA 2-thiouridine synthesizing protein E
MTERPEEPGLDSGRTPPSRVLTFNGKDYVVDEENLLLDPDEWDDGFAVGMAPEAGIVGSFSEKQWEVIRFLRRFWKERRCCPTIYQTCRALGLHVAGLHYLFPAGYQRGACKLAGISYKVSVSKGVNQPANPGEKSYRIDSWGFLLDPDEWDDRFALLKAHEMKVPDGLSFDHWRVLRFLRQEFFRMRKIPTLSEACEVLGIEMDEFERLFPDGFERGAVKLAGLRPLGGTEA